MGAGRSKSWFVSATGSTSLSIEVSRSDRSRMVTASVGRWVAGSVSVEAACVVGTGGVSISNLSQPSECGDFEFHSLPQPMMATPPMPSRKIVARILRVQNSIQTDSGGKRAWLLCERESNRSIFVSTSAPDPMMQTRDVGGARAVSVTMFASNSRSQPSLNRQSRFSDRLSAACRPLEGVL